MKLPSLKSLKKKIDILRRDYIRKRDSKNGYGNCISCGIRKAVADLQVGHYYKRQHDFTTALLTELRNVALQCEQCNGYRHGNQTGFAIGLIKKYGDGILQELERKFRTPTYWGIISLKKVVEDYQLNKQQ